MTINSKEIKWHIPSNIKYIITNRHGGTSLSPYDNFNIATHVGDSIITVNNNRAILNQFLPNSPIWLNQTHSVNILNLITDKDFNINNIQNYQFDGVVTNKNNQPLAIMTADCVPVLITNTDGTFVVNVHAGWRGVAHGIIKNTINQILSSNINGLSMSNLLIYFGPSICYADFEVGVDVYNLMCQLDPHHATFFKPSPTNPSKLLCDLLGIISFEFIKLEVPQTNITHSGFCTYCNNDLFYSYRKNGITGRIASIIWME